MIRSLSPVLLFVLCLGCGPSGPKLYPVQGTVTLDGKPLAEGNVYLREAETGDVITLPVKDGQFSGQAPTGKRRVEVAAYKLTPVPGEMGGEVQESLIAARFNSESTLSETIEAGPNEFKFAVESK